MMANLFKFVGLRHLKLRPGRTILTTLGIAFGVTLFVAIQIINRSTSGSFQENIESVTGKAQLTVSAGETGFSEEKLNVVQKIPEVLYAVPMIQSVAYFAGKSETLMILGIDLLKDTAIRTYKTTDEKIMEDPLTFLNQPDSIIITRVFAQSHGLKTDSAFEVATSKGSRRLVVRGLLNPEGPAKAYGGALGIMDIDGARVTFGKENKLDRIDIVLRPQADVEVTAEKIRTALGPGFSVERPQGQSKHIERMIKSYQALLNFFSTLALLVGLFLVANSVSISVAERRREIGTLRALGALRSGIMSLFLAEAFVMGVIGAFLGVWMGRGLASLLIDMVTQSMSSQYLTPIRADRLIFEMDQILIGVGVGAGTAVAAAFWPSYKATTIEPLEAMKYSDEIGPSTSSFAGLKSGFLWGLGMLIYMSISSIFLLNSRAWYLEILAHVCTMLGCALVAPTLVMWLIKIFKKVFVSAGGTATRLAQDNLLKNSKRTGSNVMTLMIGLVMVILIATLNVSFKNTLNSWFDRVLKADLFVSSVGSLMTYQVQPLYETLGREIETVPGIKMGPQRGAYAIRFIHFQYEGKQLGLKAFDEPDPASGYPQLDIQDRPVVDTARDLFHSSEPTVVVSENFVLHFKKKTGDVMAVDTPTGRANFRIVGIVVDYASPEGVIYMSRETYKRLWIDALVDGFAISLLPGHTSQEVRDNIDRRFGRSKNLMSISNSEIRAQIAELIDEDFAYTRAIEWVALLVAMLGLLNTFLISVMERTRELGVLRALGMSRGQLQGMILQEAVVQGVFGAMVAAALGIWISYLFVTYNLAFVLGWMIHFAFPWKAVFSTLLLGVGVALLAGFYPARRAAFVEIREALGYE